jgi:hypothetical protein
MDVVRLLRQGCSIMQTCNSSGVGKSTVVRIKNGKHPGPAKGGKAGVNVRCVECGGPLLENSKCVACETLKSISRDDKRSFCDATKVRLGLDLQGEHLERYREIKRAAAASLQL